MVGCSDLAWRLLCRRHGADLCYTEMFFAERFVADPEYRARKLRTCAEDAPLVVQFCGNDPTTLAAAARLVRGQGCGSTSCPSRRPAQSLDRIGRPSFVSE